ncbi:hypothetical protein QMS71_18765 [Cronobacter sakazakii]|uniref:hypothetical protein n=1 Tax=Cronobacter sakazakii TaxID=28141 RepID=UPI000977742D|nr:hypothetical protein [Cronobacter sakazakii]MDI7557120.1 hypothetical protein [Cronobacter sakazakii]MDI7597903.1 hypothetical protein [Cronobacter sakazakii]MDK1036569.1 hypothetical protein [Cronobacter sakazakii]MDK1122848.1 hypothetical protein [Cronobacter sakazakii]MDT3632687.1 hypothetical protein [Cronobacter sakazakii]
MVLVSRVPVSIDSVQNDGAQPEAAVARAKEVKAIGLLDGLWLNAGQLLFSSSPGSTAEALDTIMNNNVRSDVLQMAALSSLLKDDASVVVLRRQPLASVPMQRAGTPDEAAAVALFFAF